VGQEAIVSLSVLALAVLSLTRPVSLATDQLHASDVASTAQSQTIASLRFVRNPITRRPRTNEGFAANQLRLEATVQAVATSGGPIADSPLLLLAWSGQIPLCNEEFLTGETGVGTATCEFDRRLSSMKVTVQACAKAAVETCTAERQVSLRDWVDVGAVFDVVTTISRAQQDVDFTLALAVSPRVQVNLWEAQRLGAYYRVGLFSTVPYIGQARTIIPTSFATDLVLDHTYGVGDFSAGVNAYVRGNLLLDVAYNGRTGKVNLIDSIRTLGQPGIVNLGDGFESIDGSLTLNAFLGQRAFVFGAVVFSRPLESRSSVSIATPPPAAQFFTAERDDFFQITAGFGTADEAGRQLGRVWGGYQRDPVITLRGVPLSGRPPIDIVIPERREWLIGFTTQNFGGRFVQTGGGTVFGWSPDDRRFRWTGSFTVYFSFV
jgi:hypothetical protein